MAPPRVRSILRYIRLNLKTGYMQDKPWEFDYIRRFPPVTNVYNPDFYTIRKMDIPYFRLYEKLKRTDARYADDHVYPTHQMDEPEALTIAKQQYQYMQNGLSEDDALRKATHEMNTTENKAYIELQTLIDKIEANGAHHYQSITKDPIVKEGLETYQKVLADYPYDTLDLGQQGEIDKFIHIYLLHWNEVQREKRMKDFVFYEKYQELLEVLFPRSSIGQKTYESYLHPRIKKSIFKQLELNDIYHHPLKKFYIEDYLHFYSLFKKDPLHHTTWELKLRASFITWSRSTLLYQSLLKKDKNLAKEFNDQMEAYLFPMILFPSRCQDLPNLTLQSIKEICYHNNIGYMRDPNSGLGGEFVSPPSTDNENRLGSDNNDDIDDEVVVNETNKLYVRRFYKLPQLLFPRDHFCATIALDQPKLDAILADTEKNLLLEEMRKEGINEHLLDEIYKQLDDYRTYKESAFKSTLDIPTPLNSGEEFDILTQIHTEAAKSLESEENPLVATPQEIVDGVENVENAENIDKKEDQVVVEEEKKESIDGLTYLNSLDTSIPFDETSKQEVEQLLKNIDFTPEKLYSLSVEHKGNLPIEFLKQFEKYPKYIEYLIVESKFIYDQERLAEPVKAVLGIDIKKLIDAKNDEEIDEVFKNVKIDDIDLSLLNENDDKVEELTKTTKKPLSNTPRRYTARNQLISDEKEDKKVEKEIVEEPLQAETARLDQVLKDLTQQVEDFFKVVDPKHTVQDLNTDEDDDEDFKKYRGLSLEELKKKIDDETVENLRKEAQAERPENWNQLLKKYFFSPDTELEKERLNLYFESSGLSLDYISTEKQLQDLEIAKNQWIVKNQKSLKQQYQEKEKARLKAEWESRGFELASADEKTLNEWKEIARYSHPLAVLHAKK